MKLIAFLMLLTLPLIGTEQDKVHGKGKIKNRDGEWIGGYTTSSTGNTLVWGEADWWIETVWTWAPPPNNQNGWYENLEHTWKVLTTCEAWNIDGCIKWKWVSFYRADITEPWTEWSNGTLEMTP